MKVLVVGSGGREHALAWKISQSPHVTHIFVAPGNGGTEIENNIINIDIKASDIKGLLAFAKSNEVDITIVGPEDPLVKGITNRFEEENLMCFGPTKEAAQLEGSKEFMKVFLEKYSIPSAEYKAFTNAKEAINYIKKKGCPIVIKADGLAAGKGVTIAKNMNEAIEAIHDSMNSQIFGDAGKKVVVEEFLSGEEASFIVMTDGKTALPFASSQDHKARDDGDLGPNTGGMGAYSPAPIVDKEIHEKIMNTVIYPTLAGLEKEGLKYIGFLYAGLMIDKNKNLKVLEFNCRFGDPETQPIMMRLKSDLAQLCYDACRESLQNSELEWDDRKSLGVVMASKGYPHEYESNQDIQNLPKSDNDLKIFHAGTKIENGKLKSNGGRVLCVTALGSTVHSAQEKAYNAISKISWKDSYFRRDIGHRAINRED